MGTSSFSRSMPWRHASKASLRCGAEHAITTLGLAHTQVARPVKDRHLADGPLLEELTRDLVQARHRQLVPRFISKAGHVPGLRMIANGADEHAGAPRGVVGDRDQRLVHGERIGRHANKGMIGHVPHPIGARSYP